MRQTVASNLESTQRLFAAVETRRQHELRGQAETLADNATLKAALDTYQSETQASRATVRADLLETIDLVLEKVAASVESDAVVLVDSHHVALAAAGRMADRWPRSRPVSLVADTAPGGVAAFDGVAHMGDRVFRVVTVPLLLDDTTIGTLYVATSLDHDYAAGTGPARRHTHRDRQRRPRRGDHARRARLAAVRVGGRRRLNRSMARSRSTANPTRSGGSSRSAIRCSTRSGRLMNRRRPRCATPCAASRSSPSSGIGLAGVGSFWLARTLSEPIGQLSSFARRDGGLPRRPRAAAADRVEPRARHAHATRSTL